MRQIDIRRLSREDCLQAGIAYCWQWTRRGEVVASINVTVETDLVWFTYRQRERGGQWQDMRYPVWLDKTACNLGGARVWWRCPVAECGRRVAVLYAGSVFACRHCHQLAYRSQRQASDDRATTQAGKLRDRLGWDPGILNGEGIKPKGMHWRTFERLRVRHDEHSHKALIGINRLLERLRRYREALLLPIGESDRPCKGRRNRLRKNLAKSGIYRPTKQVQQAGKSE